MAFVEQRELVLDTALSQVLDHWDNDLGRETITIRIPIYP